MKGYVSHGHQSTSDISRELFKLEICIQHRSVQYLYSTTCHEWIWGTQWQRLSSLFTFTTDNLKVLIYLHSSKKVFKEINDFEGKFHVAERYHALWDASTCWNGLAFMSLWVNIFYMKYIHSQWHKSQFGHSTSIWFTTHKLVDRHLTTSKTIEND